MLTTTIVCILFTSTFGHYGLPEGNYCMDEDLYVSSENGRLTNDRGTDNQIKYRKNTESCVGSPYPKLSLEELNNLLDKEWPIDFPDMFKKSKKARTERSCFVSIENFYNYLNFERRIYNRDRGKGGVNSPGVHSPESETPEFNPCIIYELILKKDNEAETTRYDLNYVEVSKSLHNNARYLEIVMKNYLPKGIPLLPAITKGVGITDDRIILDANGFIKLIHSIAINTEKSFSIEFEINDYSLKNVEKVPTIITVYEAGSQLLFTKLSIIQYPGTENQRTIFLNQYEYSQLLNRATRILKRLI